MLSANIATAAELKRDERGSVTLMFGLSVIVLSLFCGLAVDMGRVYSSKSKLGAAVDAAALAAVKGMRLENLTDAETETLARSVFDKSMEAGSGRWTDVRSFTLTLDRSTTKATVSVDASVKSMFAGLAGIPEFRLPGAAEAVFEARDIEVSLQLDLTGSMCNWGAPCTNHPKIQGLKDATKDLVDIMIPDIPTGQRVRIAFAPFTAGVNLGAYQSDVTGGITTANGCVYERFTASSQATELFPTGADRYMVAADLQAAPYNVASPRACPNAPVVPLTDNKVLLKDTVDGYVADGFTAGHNGTAWAWNMISPTFRTIWPTDSEPAAYGGQADKVAILMTDGVYNTMNGKGFSGAVVSPIAVDTCTAMKAKGIRVYTVGFALGGNATAINTMASCATSATDFFQAATPEELRDAFRAIANNIVKLRLAS